MIGVFDRNADGFLVVVSLHPKSKTSLPSHQTIPVTERSHNPYLVCRNFKLSLKGNKFWDA